MPEETSTASSSAGMDEKPCSSTVVDSSIDVTEEAKKLIGTGNRHLVMGDVVLAVNVFQEACGMLAARYGDTAEECGEALFLCGKSLLELARMENTVLGNALEGVPQSDEEEKPVSEKIESANNLDDDTRDELRRQVYEAMAADKKPEDSESTAESKVAAGLECGSTVAEPLEGHVSGKGPGSPAGVVEPAGGAEMKGKEVVQIPVAPATGEGDSSTGNQSADNDKKVFDEEEDKNAEAESGEDDDDDDDEDEANADDAEDEEVGNLQLAWEMLEVAKFIYKRKEGKEDQLMAAQAYLKLGEVSVESGNYPQALEDFQEGLALQLKHLPPHSRLLAESYYHVAMTLCYMDAYSQAIEHYNSSIKVIENRLAMLQKAIDAAEGADGAAKEKTEQEELRQLLPDITEKVADAKESQRAASLASRQALGGASTSPGFSAENGGPSSSSASSSAFASASQISTRPFEGASSSKSTSDISHLVRKKRKTDEESLVKEADAKQPKQESTINGSSSSSSANGKGVQEKEPAQTSASKSSE